MRQAPIQRQYTVECEAEGCGKVIDLDESHSFVIVYATTGVAGVAAQQCPAEQHFGCCLEHAKAAALKCLEEHLIPQYHAAVQGAALSSSSAGESSSDSPQ